MRPAESGTSPRIAWSSVVLPAPFGPQIPRKAPARDVEADVFEHEASVAVHGGAFDVHDGRAHRARRPHGASRMRVGVEASRAS